MSGTSKSPEPRRYGASAEQAHAEQSGSRAATIYWRPMIFVSLMLFVDGLGFCASLAPQTRLIEDIVCRQYYKTDSKVSGSGPSEDMCKDPAVQDVVAQLFGWQMFFDGIPGLLLAMYFGVLADKQGRRPILFLSLVGQVLGFCWVLFICWLELPLKLIWLSSWFLVIGGGSTVTGAVAMMIIMTDSTSEGIRSKVFFYSQAALIVAELIGPVVGSALMVNSVWPPLLLGLGCTIITAALAYTIPETLNRNKESAIESEYEEPSSDSSFISTLRGLARHVYKTLGFIIRHRSVLFLVLTFLVLDYSRQSLGILLQYISTRYSVPIAKANLLLSYRAFAQLVTFTVIVPLLDTFVLRYLRYAPKIKDFLLARVSIAFIMVCFAILVVAPSLPVIVVGLAFYTLGSGSNSFARSLLSSLVAQDMIGTLFTTLSMMDTLGSLLAGPIVASTFSWSMRLEGLLRGMPFILSFIMCGLSYLVLSQVRVSELPLGDEGRPNDEESKAFLNSERSNSEDGESQAETSRA